MEEWRGHYDLTHQPKSTPFTSYPNIATNDGTHRLTVKWTSLNNIRTYEKDKAKLNDALLNLIQAIIADEDGVFIAGRVKAFSILELPVAILWSQIEILSRRRFGFMSNTTACMAPFVIY
jgi:hypothetical protein